MIYKLYVYRDLPGKKVDAFPVTLEYGERPLGWVPLGDGPPPPTIEVEIDGVVQTCNLVEDLIGPNGVRGAHNGFRMQWYEPVKK